MKREVARQLRKGIMLAQLDLRYGRADAPMPRLIARAYWRTVRRAIERNPDYYCNHCWPSKEKQ